MYVPDRNCNANVYFYYVGNIVIDISGISTKVSYDNTWRSHFCSKVRVYVKDDKGNPYRGDYSSGIKGVPSLAKVSGFKAKTVKGSSKVKYTVKNLKKGRTYYVRSRAYRTVSGKKVYGPYTSSVRVKAK